MSDSQLNIKTEFVVSWIRVCFYTYVLLFDIQGDVPSSGKLPIIYKSERTCR